MYGRDVVSAFVSERTRVRWKALEGGFDVNSFSLFIFLFFRIDCSYKARGRALV